jgi:hypothetical protein
MQLQPVASASPDGDVQLHPDFLPSFFINHEGDLEGHWCGICGDPTCGVDFHEDLYRQAQIDAHGGYAVDLEELHWKRLQASIGDPLPMEHAPTVVSSRQATIAELGELVHRNGRGASLKSRSHELHKSRLRLERHGR